MTASVKAKARADAFEALLGLVLAVAYRLAINLTKNEGDADDLVQNAALLAFRNFDSFEQGTNFKAWFFKILTNCFLMEIRKQKRRPASVELDRVQEGYLFSRTEDLGWHDQLEDPAHYLMEKIGVSQIAKALRGLPEEYRVVATLYFAEDLSYLEIAEYLGCPVGTVRSRLHRGRKMLQRMLWSVAKEEGVIKTLSDQ